MVRVHPRTQIVTPIVSCVTSGFNAPGVLPGSGSAVCAHAAGVARRARMAVTHCQRFAAIAAAKTEHVASAAAFLARMIKPRSSQAKGQSVAQGLSSRLSRPSRRSEESDRFRNVLTVVDKTYTDLALEKAPEVSICDGVFFTIP